jgi:AhpD family alkylhydroperoxidase
MSTISMPPANGRLQHRKVIPEALGALGAVNATLEDSTLGMRLIDLVRQRISQINGCAYCVDSHARDLLAGGEDLQRLNSLSTWREVTLFTEREPDLAPADAGARRGLRRPRRVFQRTRDR